MPKTSQTKIGSPPSRPVQPGNRLIVVDVLRGFALFGILFVNIFSMAGLPYRGPFPDSLSQILQNLIEFLVEAKFYHLFSFLFGWGISIQLLRARERGQPFLGRFFRRMIILFLFGMLHYVLLWRGDILTDYATFGFLLVLFFWMPTPVILVVAILMIGLAVLRGAPLEFNETFNSTIQQFIAGFNIQAASGPAYGANYIADVIQRAREFILRILQFSYVPYYFFSVFGMFLLGLYVGKKKIFEQIDHYSRLLKVTLVVGLALGLTGNYLFAFGFPNFIYIRPDHLRFAQFTCRTIGAPTLMLAYVCGLTLLFERTKVRDRLLPLANVGRMALTNYLSHSFVALIVFQVLGLYSQISLPIALVMITLLYFGQIKLSAWWLENHPFGPMEWLWRTLTYGRLQPWRKLHGLDENESALPNWLQKLNDLWNRLSPRLRLSSVGALLLLWTVALVVWQSNLSPSQGTFYQQLEARLQADENETDGQNEGDQQADQGDESGPAIVATPQVEQVEYNPGELAANGDFIALSAAFDPEMALEYIQALTQPAFNGRIAGSPGGWAAGDYIADQFGAYGLQPAGDDGTYFQPFETQLVVLAQEPTITITDQDGHTFEGFQPFVDFAPWLYEYAGAGTGTGQVIFANNCTHDDFDNIIVVDKIVLCRWQITQEDEVLNALEHGAAGLLLIPLPDFALDFKYDYKPAFVPEPLPTMLVSNDLVEELLRGSGVSLTELSLTYHPLELSTSVSMDIEAEGAEACVTNPCTSRNVLGVLPGRDPEFSHQVIILGAHYDHMGGTPGGTYWPGANDNASGVSLLLEIARSWQAAGFVPRRTVVFAAWDAEEMGLLGSEFYVENPQYPLEDTVAVLNFDVVGLGDGEVEVFAGGGLDEQVNALAAAVDIPTIASDASSSDHAPFLGTNIPTTAFFTAGYEDSLTLHRTNDTVDTLSPTAIRNAGRLASLSAMVISDVHPSIEEVLLNRQAAVDQGDQTAFLSTSSGLAQQLDRVWFENMQALNLTALTYQILDLQVEGDRALATISLEIHYPDPANPDAETGRVSTAEAEIRFIRQEDGNWLWDGPDVSIVANESNDQTDPIIWADSQGEEWLQSLAETIWARYREAARLIPIRSQEQPQIIILPTQAALRVLIDPTLPGNRTLWTGSNFVLRVAGLEGAVDEVGVDNLTARLILLQAGLPDEVPELIEVGLANLFHEERDSQGFQTQFIPILSGALEIQAPSDVGRWAALRYLVDSHGWTGLRRFLLDLGQACPESGCADSEALEQALTSSFNISLEDFNQAWRAYWGDQLADWQEQIDALLQARSTALLEADQTAFLRTLDSRVANLRQEQLIWFEQLSRYELENFSLTGEPIAQLDDGSLLAEVHLEFEIPEINTTWSTADLTSIARLTPTGGSLRWAGYPFEHYALGNILVYSPAEQTEAAQALAEFLQEIYNQTNLAFGVPNPPRLTLELFTDPTDYRFHTNVVRLAVDEPSAISVGNSVIQLLLPDYSSSSDLSAQHSFFTRLFGRQILLASGLRSEWLLKGLTILTAPELDHGLRQQYAARKVTRMQYAIRDEEVSFTPQDIPSDEYLSTENLNLAYAYAWHSLSYLVNRYGEEALTALAIGDRQGRDLADNFLAITGQPLDEFMTEWNEDLWSGFAPQAWIDLVDSFDTQGALNIIDELTSETYTGRLGGTQGAMLAAEYIADQFQQLGLTPLGNATELGRNGNTAEDEETPLSPPEEPNAYLQYYPRPSIVLQYQPRLTFQAELDGGDFQYRVDYVLPDGVAFSDAPAASGEIVWVQAYTESIDLTGKIVLRRLELSLEEEIQLAVEHGAIGLIYPGQRDSERVLLAKVILDPRSAISSPIPVIELSDDGFDRLLDQLGETMVSMNNKPIVARLGLEASLDIRHSPNEWVWSANVLGLLPGSDPARSQDWIIIGAHYDHVGDDPPAADCPEGVSPPDESCVLTPGIRYPGANDNASGIALMLEIARVFQESGYRPARSILFVAWGDQEIGQMGSTYYVEHPVHPLDDTSATFHFDSIGSGSGYYLHAFGETTREATLLYQIENAAKVVNGRLQTGIEAPRNDGTSFASQGIPTLFLTWKGSNEDNYPTEYADQVQADQLEKAARMIILTILGTAE